MGWEFAGIVMGIPGALQWRQHAAIAAACAFASIILEAVACQACLQGLLQETQSHMYTTLLSSEATGKEQEQRSFQLHKTPRCRGPY